MSAFGGKADIANSMLSRLRDRQSAGEAPPPWLARPCISQRQPSGVHAPMVAILAHVLEHGLKVSIACKTYAQTALSAEATKQSSVQSAKDTLRNTGDTAPC